MFADGEKMMNMRIINDISNFIFVEDVLEKADAILIPGGSYPELPERAAEMFRLGYAKYIVPAGGFSVKLGYFPGPKSKAEKYNKNYETECDFYTDILIRNGVDAKCIILEDKSRFTEENALFTKAVLDEHGITLKKAIICCKAFHARRCLMFYQFVFPHTEFIIAPVSEISGLNITRDNWYKDEIGLSKVQGELARLGTQFGRYLKKIGS